MKIYLFLLSLLCSFHAFSQNTTLKWSETDKLSSNNRYLGKKDGLIYILRSAENAKLGNTSVDAYDEKDFVKKNTIILSVLLKKINGNKLNNIFIQDDKLFVFSENTIRKKLIGSIISLDGKVTSEQIEVDAEHGVEEKKPYHIDFLDGQKKWAVYREVESGKDDAELIRMSLFSLNLEKIKDLELKLPYTFKSFSISLLLFDGEDHFMLKGKVTEQEKKTVKITHVLFSYNIKTNESIDIQLPFDLLKTGGLHMSIYQGDMQFYGLQDREGKTGIAFVRVDKNGKVTDNKFTLLTSDVKLTGKYLIKDIYTYNTHTFVFLEYESSYSTQYTFQNQIHYQYFREAGSIIVARLNQDHEVDWNITVPKYQVIPLLGISYYDEDLSIVSFASFVSNDQIYLFYNDNPDHFSKNVIKEFNWKQYKTSCLGMITINSNTGSFEKKLLMMNKENDRWIRPFLTTQIDNNTLLLGGLTKKRKQFYGLFKLN